MHKNILFVFAALVLVAGCTQTSFNANFTDPSQDGISVRLIDVPASVPADRPFNISWRVDAPGKATAQHTAVHYDTESPAGSFGTDIGPADSGYSHLTGKFTSGNFTVPAVFTDEIMPLEGKMYLRAHAIINGKNYWSSESAINVIPANNSSNTSENLSAVREFTMTASQWKFEPGVINARLGDTVVIHIRSTDIAHGIQLEAFGVNEALPPGKEVTVTFRADKAGTFEFRCNVPCGEGHRDMAGTIVIT